MIAFVITGIALLAVLVARAGVARAAARSAVAARLRTLYTLLAALLALRLLAALVPDTAIAVPVMLVASWLPMAGLRLVEELRRRHAPRELKLVALGGALAFTAMALTVGIVWSTGALLALAAYQAAMLAAMAVLLASGASDLAPAERLTAATFLLALLFAIPLAASDFAALLPHATVRGGAFAVLILVLATSRLATRGGTPALLLRDLAACAAASGAIVLVAVAAVPHLSGDAAASLAAGGAALAALLLLVERFAADRAGPSGLIAALARAPGTDPATIIAAHPLLATGRMVGDDELAGYPANSLAQLAEHRVISADIGDGDAKEAARDLLDAAAATHLLRISRTPPRFLAIAAGGLAAPALDDELAVAARLIGGVA